MIIVDEIEFIDFGAASDVTEGLSLGRLEGMVNEAQMDE